MFRTRATALNQDLTTRTAATQLGRVQSVDLRLRWTHRNGHLTARWEREPHDLEDRPRIVSNVTA
jgi:hypothetical protein